MLGDDLREALGHAVPTDRAAQANATEVLGHQLTWLVAGGGLPLIDAGGDLEAVDPAGPARPPFVLDVGCGRGEGLDAVRRFSPDAHWLGVDIDDSAEVDERPMRADAEFRSFNGIDLPVAEASVDLVFSQQVFEHVARPEPLLADIARVMRPGALFCGSVSQLEAFHSRSVGGFTPYGWRLALERAGLHLLEVRPGVDVGTLLARRLMKRSKRFDRYWITESPGNRLLNGVARVRRLGIAEHGTLKLMFAGQITFVAQRPWT